MVIVHFQVCSAHFKMVTVHFKVVITHWNWLPSTSKCVPPTVKRSPSILKWSSSASNWSPSTLKWSVTRPCLFWLQVPPSLHYSKYQYERNTQLLHQLLNVTLFEDIFHSKASLKMFSNLKYQDLEVTTEHWPHAALNGRGISRHCVRWTAQLLTVYQLLDGISVRIMKALHKVNVPITDHVPITDGNAFEDIFHLKASLRIFSRVRVLPKITRGDPKVTGIGLRRGESVEKLIVRPGVC